MRALTFCLCFIPAAAGASVYDEFTGLRSQAMGGAHRGLGNSNDTLFLNPAGMVLAKRYSVDLAYGFTAMDDLSHISLSAVDSKSGPVAGAAGYTHDRGDEDGVDARLHRIYMALAYPIVENFGFGITVRNLRGEYTDVASGERRDLSLYNGDIGIAVAAGEGFGFGFTYHNVLRLADDERVLTPPSLGFGAAYTTGFFSLAADVTMDLRDEDNRRMGYHVGGEYFAADQYPIRLGWQYAPFVRRNGSDANENIVSGGLGWITGGGAIEATFAQSVERPKNWAISGALKFFL
jgi:hypothetical protein